MSRQPRIDLPGVPQHVLQRGNNCTACFFQPSDYTFYLNNLKQAAHQHDCDVYAYVLMTNHVHLLVSGAEMGCISAMMQSLGRRYVWLNILVTTGGRATAAMLREKAMRGSRITPVTWRWVETRFVGNKPTGHFSTSRYWSTS